MNAIDTSLLQKENEKKKEGERGGRGSGVRACSGCLLRHSASDEHVQGKTTGNCSESRLLRYARRGTRKGTSLRTVAKASNECDSAAHWAKNLKLRK